MVTALALLLLAGVKEDLAQATQLLKSAQEEAAVQLLTRALDRSGLSKPERAELYVLLGIARFNLRDEEGASLAFQRGIEANAAATLPPRLAPPRARELFESAKIDVGRRAALPPVPEPRPDPQPVVVAAASAPAAAVARAEPRTAVGRWVGVAIAAVGAVAGGTGGFLLASGSGLRGQAVAEPVATSSARLFAQAQTQWATGMTLLGVGAVVLVAGVLVALLL